MSRALLSGLTAALALFTCGPAMAAEPSVFGFFEAICLAPDADKAAVTREAMARGFVMQPPTSLLAGDQRTLTILEQALGSGRFLVVVTREPAGPPGFWAESCAVSVDGKDEAVVPALVALVPNAMPKSVGQDTFVSFRLTPEGRAPLAMDDKPANDAAMISGDLGLLVVRLDEDSTSVALSRGRKPAP